MPLDGSFLGFKNTWYEPALATAGKRELEPGLTILLISPVYFCASKLEVFRDRGKDDYQSSRDLEDMISVIDGREELVGEINAAKGDVRSYLGKQIAQLLQARGFLDALAGHLPPDDASQARLTIVTERLRAIARLQ